MLGKKMSNSSVSKGRNSTASVDATTTVSKGNGKVSTGGGISPYHSSTSAIILPTITEPQPNYATLIKGNENAKLLPHYSSALERPHDESLPADEMDPIQMELEMLLSTVALRMRSLKSDIDSLDKEDKKHKKGSTNDKQPNSPSTSGKRKRHDGVKKSSNKDPKAMIGNLKQSKVKNLSSQSPAHSQHTDDSMDAIPYYQSINARGDQPASKLLVPKNDIPNKFWLSVEPYCMPITQEDLKLLDELIDEYSSPLVPPIPELGPHYTTQWTTEDLRDEQDNSNQNAKANKRFTCAATTDVINMMKKCDKLIGEGITGPLTQRLVSALLEENLIQGQITENSTQQNGINETPSENNSSTANRPLTALLKSGVDVEKRLKKELLDLGILDASDFAKEREDEVLNEIKRVRSELHAISGHNLSELKSLREAVIEEMKRLDIKRKLDSVDQELIESYKKVWLAKQKRRPLTKQERTAIYRLSEEQKNLAAQLEAIPMPGFKHFNPASANEKKII